MYSNTATKLRRPAMGALVCFRSFIRLTPVILVLAIIMGMLNPPAGSLALAENQPTAADFISAKPTVLVLHSYHSGFTWTDNIAKGLGTAFAAFADRIDFCVEYMDTRRFHSRQYFAKLKDIYRLKYAKKKIAVVICSDDQALNFVLGAGEELFDGIPIVFCSVSGYIPSMREGRELTGLLESIDIRATLDIALKFQPRTREVAVITDMTRTGQALKAKAAKIFNNYDQRLRFTYLENLTVEGLNEKVATLTDGTVIFMFIFNRDKAGRVFSHEHNLKTLHQHARVPIYAVWKFYLGHGIVGGKLTSGEAEGLMAGRMALRILRGERASEIPLQKSPTRYMFDYRQLKRYKVSESSLPPDSLIMHQPGSFYRDHQSLIWIVAIVFTLLLALVLFLVGNIARRRQVETALRQGETKFFKIFDTSPIWMVLATVAEGRYIEANQAFYEITGYSPEEVIGRTSIEIGLWVNPADRSGIRKILEEKGRLVSLPVQFRMKNGDIRDFLWSATVFDFGEELTALSGIIDITQRKQAEKALVRSEKRFRDLAELLPETIFEIDIEGNLTYANRRAFDKFLYTQEDFERGLNAFDLVVPEDRQRAMEDTVIIIGGEHLGLLEYNALRKDGSTFPVLAHSTVIYQQDQAVGLRGFMIDISDQKRLEAQLLQAQKLKSLGTLAGGIAHDFNNLLMGIQGRTSLMTMDTESFHPHYEHLREIEKYVIRAAGLTKQLLGFARGGKYEVKPTDLNHLIAQNSTMFGRTKKEIAIHRKYQKDLWTVEVDQGQVDQVLLNIYVNAWQAMPQGGELYIQTENVILDENFVSPHDVNPGPYVMISVTDSGIGMDESTVKRVFDPFFSTKVKERGTGLGLASAYGIIKSHDGIITVDSGKGQGATFKIYLPASDKAVPTAPQLNPDVPAGSETILVVDDEEMILNAGRALLEKIGYRVLTAPSGRRAIRVYEAQKAEIDLVVLDMVMPDLSGSDTYDQLKKINPTVKVLLSSGYSINGQASEILDRGCNGFIQKPFTMNAFSQKVREILDQ